jgi:hypothetical protein
MEDDEETISIKTTITLEDFEKEVNQNSELLDLFSNYFKNNYLNNI